MTSKEDTVNCPKSPSIEINSTNGASGSPKTSSSCSTPKYGSPLAPNVKVETFEFEVPPEAPVFYPTEEEFQDPLAYINKIRPVAENTGICKIKPPANWQPPFAVDVDKLRFTPRIQRLNELEAKTGVKLNFLDQFAMFWELRGSSLSIPMVEKRALDLYTLHRLVQREGGSVVVSKEQKWSKIAVLMGYPPGKGIGTILKTHFERLLYPFDVFRQEEAVNILAKYVCHCGRGDVGELILLCDVCDDSYHTLCFEQPLSEIPKRDWYCPKCVAVEVSKPTEAFGFEQAPREYSLQQFAEMADQFKSEYFNMPVHVVPTHVVEKEFWRIVSSIDEDVTVEYGADLHTMDHGSGFPTTTSRNLHPGNSENASSSWNLNNLPVLEGSVLGYIDADISGMKVPWMYVGMCFATSCWHNEDHWNYSINYLHWGQPKTWYGVPGSKAVAFEETMKLAAPELFQSQPDLFHQLVTIKNPNILMNAGVPVYRTDQHAGEFVVTFPRAYHAGFNQGYNFAEAVNFAPADWLKMGRECILHYSHLRRFCVFSHDELVCKMALEPDKLSPLIAAATYQDMLQMVEAEKQLHKNLLDWGVTSAERESFELLPDNERQCEVCKTTCFLSALTCSCTSDTLVCLRHYMEFCKCPPNEHTLRYRYTLDELSRLLQKLKIIAEAFDVWLNKVRDSLYPAVPSTLSLFELKSLLTEAEDKKFPKCELLTTLGKAIEGAEKCASVIRQLDSTMDRTRTCNSNDKKYLLNLEELNLFIGEIDSLAFISDEAKIVKDLLNESNKFEENSKRLLQMSLKECSVEDIEKCLEHGEAICIELPSLHLMRDRLRQAKWMAEVTAVRRKAEVINLETIRHLLSTGASIIPDLYVETELQELKRLLMENEDWEDRAQSLLKQPPPNLMGEIEKLRKKLLDWGVTSAEREAFELLPDDECQCEVCKTTCDLSAITCSCISDTLVCFRHYMEVCKCPPTKHTLRYRYMLDEVPRMLQQLKIKGEAFDVWFNTVRDSLYPAVPSTLSLFELKGLLTEAEDKKFPKCELLTTLGKAIEGAEKCASVIRQLHSTMARTSTCNSNDKKYHLNLEELNLFIGEIDSLACISDEAKIVKDLLNESNKFEENSKRLLQMSLKECSVEDIEKCLEHGEAICIELPSLHLMRHRLRQAKWMAEVTAVRKKAEVINLETIRHLLSTGDSIIPDLHVESELQELKRLLMESEDWEGRAQSLLKQPPPNLIGEIEKLLAEAEDIETYLPTEEFLTQSMESVKAWMKNLEEINAAEFYPYIDIIENLIQKGRSIPLPLPDVEELEQSVVAAYGWKDKTSRTFLRKNPAISLMEALSPRIYSNSPVAKNRRKNAEDELPLFKVTNEMDPGDFVNKFKQAEEREVEGLKALRMVNLAKTFNSAEECKFCTCQRGAFGFMMKCELCKDWFHSTCVTLPKIANIKIKGNFTAIALRMGFKDSKFLCPACFRTKRPRLETIRSLLVSLRKLSVRIPEGEILQCLTERATTWQDRAKQLLQTNEFEAAVAKLSLLSQKNSEAAARQKTEKIISTELKRAASNPAVQQHVQEIASCSGLSSEDQGDSNSSHTYNGSEGGEFSKVSSSLPDDTVDEHAYSLHFPNADDSECILQFSEEARQQLEDVLMQGDLLEVSLDETLHLWKLLQAAREPEKEPVLIDFDAPGKTSPVRKGRKLRSDKKEAAKKLKQLKNDLDKKLTKRKAKDVNKDTIRKRTDITERQGLARHTHSSSEDKDPEERCAATSCLQPSGQKVDWVQCDGGCEQWFHMACVGLSAQEINEDEDYICIACSQSNSAFGSLQQSPESQSSDNPLSPDSTQPPPTQKEGV